MSSPFGPDPFAALAALGAPDRIVRDLLEAQPSRVAVVDRNLRLCWCNEGMIEFLGLTPVTDEFGQTWEVADQDVAGPLFAIAEQVMVTGEPLELDAPLPRPDGTTVWLRAELVPLRGEDGEVSGLAGYVQDISEEQRARDDLRRHAEAMGLLAEAAEEGLYILRHRPSLEYTYMNAAMERILGYRLADFQVHPDLALERVHPDDHDTMLAGRRDPAGMDWPAQLRWRRPDDTYVYLWNREVPMLDDGRVVGVVGVVRRLQTRGEEERVLLNALARKQKATDQLRRVDEMRQTFLRAVSHELRTPLTAVLGYAETLRYHGRRLDADRSDDLVRRLTENALRLRSLLDDLLDIDRLSRGTLTLEARTTDVSEVVLRAVEHVPGSASRIRVSAQPVEAWVDGPKVERIVENLVANALKHGGADVTAWVTVRPSGEQVELVVEDDGVGIPPALRERLFDPFEQGPESAHAASPGSGLGLTLVRELTQLHAGQVEVGERPGGGARFVVRLPVAARD